MAQAKDGQWLDLANGGPILDSIINGADYETLKVLALTNNELHRTIAARFRTEIAQIRTYFINHPMPTASPTNASPVAAWNDRQLLELIYHLNGGQSATTDGIVINFHEMEHQFDTYTETWSKNVNEIAFTDDDNSNYTEHWKTDGQFNRVDGPAFIDGNETTWFRHGRMHRLGAPAHIIKGGDIKPGCITLEEYWYNDGVLHRDGLLPAVEKIRFVDNGENYSYCINQKLFYINGELVDEIHLKSDYKCAFSEWDAAEDE